MTFSVLSLLSGPYIQTTPRRLNARDSEDTARPSVTTNRPKTVTARRAVGVDKKQVPAAKKRFKHKRQGKRR
jgi:hypothetical protein